MKQCKILPHFVVFLLFLAFSSPAHSGSRENSILSIQTDGQVMVDGLSFVSMGKYLNSDYFRTSGRRCGTKVPERTDSLMRASRRKDDDCTTALTVIRDEYWPDTVLTIPVVVHIIHKVDGTGNLDDDRVQRQIEVLNEDFTEMAGDLGEEGNVINIQYRLEAITRTANDNWFYDNNERGYKTALGWDQSRYCNIYVNSAGGYLGYTYFPQEEMGVMDGLVILYEAFGGRGDGYYPYNQGCTVVHEMGHYLGLYHTFEGFSACQNTYGTGDLIVDTPAEATDHYGCTQTSTCDSLDPIHNYMNYTDDACMNQFTQEQANRMVCSTLNYRPVLVGLQPNFGLLPSLLMQLLNEE